MVGVNGASLEGGERSLDEPRFIQGVCVNSHLHVQLIRHPQTTIDGRGCGAPVLMEFESDGPRHDLLAQWFRCGAISLSKKAQIHRIFLGGFQHAMQIPDARCAGRGKCAMSRTRAPTDHGGDATGQGVFDLLRADEMDVGIDSPRRDDVSLSRNDFRRGTDYHGDAILEQGISGMADANDAPMLDADVRFDYSLHGIEDRGVGNYQIETFRIQSQR